MLVVDSLLTNTPEEVREVVTLKYLQTSEGSWSGMLYSAVKIETASKSE